MNDWFKLLLAFRNGKFPKYFYGLTPRFIIGACQVPIGSKFKNEKSAYEFTLETFEEMKSYNTDGLIVSSNECGIHNGPVMQLIEAEWNKDSIGTYFDKIWSRYGEEIIKGEFSINLEERNILKTIFNQ